MSLFVSLFVCINSAIKQDETTENNKKNDEEHFKEEKYNTGNDSVYD